MTARILKQELLKRVPSPIRDEPYFQALLDHIRQKDIQTKEHLRDFLQKEASIIESWLNDNRTSGATSVKNVRDKTIHLDVLNKCLKLTEEFLF